MVNEMKGRRVIMVMKRVQNVPSKTDASPLISNQEIFQQATI
jgi:hypothetical protein